MEDKKLTKGFYKRGGVTLKQHPNGREAVYSNVIITDASLVDYILEIDRITKGRVSPSAVLSQLSEAGFDSGLRFFSVPIEFKKGQKRSKTHVSRCLHFPSINRLYSPDGFHVDESGVYKVDGEERKLICETPVWVDKVVKNSDNGSLSVKLAYITPELTLKARSIVLRSVKHFLKETKLLRYGFTVVPGCYDDFVHFLDLSVFYCPDRDIAKSKIKTRGREDVR